MTVDISQVRFDLLKLVLEIVDHVAILVGMKIVESSPHERTQFFYI